MELGLGHLGIAPSVFWSYSLVEWYAAIDGYMTKIGANNGDGDSITSDEYEKLKEEHPDDRQPT